MMHGFGFGYGWGGFLFMILLWGLLIAAVVGLVKVIFSGGSGKRTLDSREDDDSLAILNRRYAGGEISREEYETIKKDLTSS